MARLDKCVALVTGAASGLGLAIARRLDADGAFVVSADIADDAGRAAAARLKRGIYTHLDVTSEDEWIAIFRMIRERHGEINLLVNNAGIATVGSIEDLSFDQFKREIEIDLYSVFLGSREAVRNMKEKGGNIVNISSASGLKASGYLAAYNAAKAGVTLMTKSIALHCGENEYPIRCNSVHPGAILSEMTQKVMSQVEDPDAYYRQLVATHPIGRLGRPEEIAAMVAFLASDEADFATGGAFSIDGGLSL